MIYNYFLFYWHASIVLHLIWPGRKKNGTLLYQLRNKEVNLRPFALWKWNKFFKILIKIELSSENFLRTVYIYRARLLKFIH